jgi:hypothetical protein
MKITDLFDQDLLNQKAVIINELKSDSNKKNSINIDIIIIAFLFAMAIITLNNQKQNYGDTRKKN